MAQERSNEELLRQLQALSSEALNFRHHLDSVWEALGAKDEDQKAIARQEMIRLIERWGDFPSIVDSWLREKRL